MSDELKVYPLMLHESAMDKLGKLANAKEVKAESILEDLIDNLYRLSLLSTDFLKKERQDELIVIYVRKFLEDVKKEPNMMFQMGLAMRLIHDLTTEIK